MNEEHLKHLNKGKIFWNEWRINNSDIEPDFKEAQLTDWDSYVIASSKRRNLRGYDLRGANFFRANLRGVDLSGANLSGAYCHQANLEDADLTGANLQPEGSFYKTWLEKVNLSGARLHKANFSSVYLYEANLSSADCSNALFFHTNLGSTDLYKANFSNSDLRKSNLQGARLVKADFTNAVIDNSLIYGTSAWDVILENTSQKDLVISNKGEPVVTVDKLEVGQFIHLLLNNAKIRDVIDTIGEKGVLILGRFTKERKMVLDAIRGQLRERGFVPMMFDFERPTQRDFTETIKTLAGLSRFIIADITNPKSSPLELQAIMPDYMIPFVPIIQEDEEPFAMFCDLNQKYGEWVLDVLQYDSVSNLLKVLDKAVIRPALEKADQLLLKKTEAIQKRHVKDYYT